MKDYWIASGLGIAGAVSYFRWLKRARVVPIPARTPAGGQGAILADLPTSSANLYYLTKPPWLIVPIKPFRADDRDFPKPHRYRDPQGPLADIYNPLMRMG